MPAFWVLDCVSLINHKGNHYALNQNTQTAEQASERLQNTQARRNPKVFYFNAASAILILSEADLLLLLLSKLQLHR